MRVAYAAVLGQIHEAHDIARLFVAALLVGNPHLDAVDAHPRRYVGQLRGKLVVVVAEEVGQEEVAVLVVGIGPNLEGGRLGTAAGVDRLRLRLLLRNQGRGGELAELHGGLDTEEGRAASYERRPGSHAHVTGLDVLDDFVLLALVLQLEVLGVEVEGSIGVVVHVERHLVAHLGGDRCLYLFVEIEVGLFTRTHRQGRVVELVVLQAHIQLDRALGGQLHAAGAEDLLEGPERKVHVEEVELRLAVLGKVLGIALAVILLHRLAQRVLVVLVGREHEGGSDIDTGHPRVNHIAVSLGVILHLGLQVRRVLQVHGSLLVNLVVRLGHRFGHGETHLYRVGSRTIGTPRLRRLGVARGILRLGHLQGSKSGIDT